MTTHFLKSEVVENKKLNDKFRLIRLKCQDEAFNFEAGQFVVLRVADNIFRSYSIASRPEKLPFWEIFADITPMGPGSQMLAKLVSGDIVQNSSARGVFILKNDGAKNIVMGATGCGLASIKPLIEHLLTSQDRKSVSLFWGLRHVEDICYQDLLAELQRKYSHFNYEIILSQPETPWPKTGHITNYLAEFAKSLPSPKTSIYLCGGRAMIDQTVQRLQQLGFPANRIYFERYY